MRAKALYAQTSLQSDPFGTTQINNPARGKKARELSEAFKLEYLEIANPFMEGRTLSMWVKCTMKVVKLERALETDTWLLNESCWGLAWPPSPLHTRLFPKYLKIEREERGGTQKATNGLLKAINSFLALFKGSFASRFKRLDSFQSKEALFFGLEKKLLLKICAQRPFILLSFFLFCKIKTGLK